MESSLKPLAKVARSCAFWFFSLIFVVSFYFFHFGGYASWERTVAEVTDIHCGLETEYQKDARTEVPINRCSTYYQYLYDGGVYSHEIQSRDRSAYDVGDTFDVDVNPQKPMQDHIVQTHHRVVMGLAIALCLALFALYLKECYRAFFQKKFGKKTKTPATTPQETSVPNA